MTSTYRSHLLSMGCLLIYWNQLFFCSMQIWDNKVIFVSLYCWFMKNYKSSLTRLWRLLTIFILPLNIKEHQLLFMIWICYSFEWCWELKIVKNMINNKRLFYYCICFHYIFTSINIYKHIFWIYINGAIM